MEAPRAADARALEAAGVDAVSFEFRGVAVTIPRAIESWPLDALRAGKTGRAIRQLLGDQFARVPLKTRGDALELSHRMADACGVTPLPEAESEPGAAFGAVPVLLDIVDNHGDDLEADLRRFFGVDYREPGAVSLRQVWVYVRRLPSESALMTARNKGEPPWTRQEILAAQLWELFTRKPYPGRAITRQEFDKWMAEQAANDDTMDRLSEREAYYASGQNMRAAGVDPGGRAPKGQPPRKQQPTPHRQALTVAMKNARRSPGRANDGRTAPAGQRPARPTHYDPAGSGWG